MNFNYDLLLPNWTWEWTKRARGFGVAKEVYEERWSMCSRRCESEFFDRVLTMALCSYIDPERNFPHLLISSPDLFTIHSSEYWVLALELVINIDYLSKYFG